MFYEDITFKEKALKNLLKKEQIKYILFLVIAGVLFLHVNRGVDFSDTGYNLANYENFPNVNHTWMVSTILSMSIGKLITFFPFGHTMLFMNIYCTLIAVLFTAVFYFTLSKVFDYRYVFVGLLVAVLTTWGPYVILYHYLSYFIFASAGLLLAIGLSKDSYKIIALSSALLALNVFICFPNICEVAIGALLIADMIIERRNRVKEIFLFAGTYIGVLLSGIALIMILFGRNAYFDMIKGLFSMSETATSYGPFNMVLTMLEGYRWDFGYFAVFLILSLIMSFAYKRASGRGVKVVIVCMAVLSSFGVLRVMRYYGSISFDYQDYGSYYSIAVMTILLSLFVSIVSAINSKLSVYVRLLSCLVPIIVLITPLGSNSGVYTLLNGLFIVLPISLGLLAKNDNKLISCAPYVASVSILILALLFQCSLFKINFTYRDVQSQYVRISKDDNKVLAGMLTSSEKKEYIKGLTGYLRERELEGENAIIFGHIPMTSYALSLKNAISHIWPSLDSYPIKDFEDELNSLDYCPLIVYQSGYGDLLTKDYSESYSDKEILLCEFAKQHDYEKVYENEFFTVLQSQKR